MLKRSKTSGEDSMNAAGKVNAFDTESNRKIFERHRLQTNVDGIRSSTIHPLALIPIFYLLDLYLIGDKYFVYIQAFRVFCLACVVYVRLLVHYNRPFVARHSDVVLFAMYWVIAMFCAACSWAHIGYESPYSLALMFIFMSVVMSVCWPMWLCAIFYGAVYVSYLLPLALGAIKIHNFGTAIGYQMFIVGMMIETTLMHKKKYASEKKEYFANLDLQNTKLSLENALEKLREMDTMKNHFFANISHELRTPLTLSLGPVELMLSEESRPKHRERLTMVRNNQLRLLKLIEELLDLTKLEAGKMPVRFCRSDVCESLRTIAETIRPAFEDKGLKLSLELPSEPLWLYIDPPKFDKVLMNLLSNAFKFTEAGGEIAMALRSEGKQAEITVRDTGSGIPADKVGSIFERFVQADESTTRKYSGTGIGLALVKEYIELHRASITVRSELGKGSTFVLSFPMGKEHLPASDLEPTAQQRQRQRTPSYAPHLLVDFQVRDSLAKPVANLVIDADRRRLARSSSAELELSPTAKIRIAHEQAQLMQRPLVLVVDDTPDMRRYLVSLLEPDYEVHTAEDGEQGLEMARQLAPDLIISDVMMPRMSGEELCLMIRQDSGPLSRTPIVLVTARADVQGKLTGLEGGADDYLFKPFHIDEFAARVRNLLRQRRQEMALYLAHRRLDADLEFAREFQHSLLPSLTIPEPLRCHAVFQPLDAVGGDIYDVTVLEDGRTRILLVDVTDHGVQAALRSTVVTNEYGHFRHLLGSPGEVLTLLNDKLVEHFGERVSCSLCCVDVQVTSATTWRVRYAQGGHAPIVAVGLDSVRPVQRERGMILGIRPGAKYATGEMDLNAGERLFMYTDGLEEQSGASASSFADAALDATLTATRRSPTLEQAVELIIGEMHAFRGDFGQEDDVTLIGLEMATT